MSDIFVNSVRRCILFCMYLTMRRSFSVFMAAIMYSGSRGNSVLVASDIAISIARVPSSIIAILIFLRYRDSSPVGLGLGLVLV